MSIKEVWHSNEVKWKLMLEPGLDNGNWYMYMKKAWHSNEDHNRRKLKSISRSNGI